MSGNKHFIQKISVVFFAILLTGEISWGQSGQGSLSRLTSKLDLEFGNDESSDKSKKSKKKEFPLSVQTKAKRYFLNPDYLFPDKRDPFVPLLSRVQSPSGGDGSFIVERNDKKPKKVGFKRFGKELKKLKPIPYEFFKKIKSSDPSLYSNLERYGKLFREKRYLRKVGKSKYFGIVNRYRDLIKLANQKAKKSPKTPLQTPIKKLKLVGIIWGEDNKRALVETSNAKGHSVKAGSLIGENFGVIQSIESSKIVILEKKRNFDGNISSKTDEIRLKQSS
jgi:hypothetical protein